MKHSRKSIDQEEKNNAWERIIFGYILKMINHIPLRMWNSISSSFRLLLIEHNDFEWMQRKKTTHFILFFAGFSSLESVIFDAILGWSDASHSQNDQQQKTFVLISCNTKMWNDTRNILKVFSGGETICMNRSEFEYLCLISNLWILFAMTEPGLHHTVCSFQPGGNEDVPKIMTWQRLKVVLSRSMNVSNVPCEQFKEKENFIVFGVIMKMEHVWDSEAFRMGEHCACAIQRRKLINDDY